MITHQLMEEIYQSTAQVTEHIDNAFRYTAISINLINKSRPKDYDISDITKISINLDANHEHVKSKYITWIIGNCLSHMFEVFTCHLDFLIQIINKEFPKEKIVLKSKHERTCEAKLEKIYEKICDKYLNKVPLRVISDDQISAINTIREARNCLVHRQGIVDTKMINSKENNLFELKYYYIKDYLILTDGSKIAPSEYTGPKENIKTIWSGLGLYIINCQLNEHLIITPQELFRIGVFFYDLNGVLSSNLRMLFNYDYPDNIIII
jgi:hypothetical protein